MPTSGCRDDKLQCWQWWQIWQYDNSGFQSFCLRWFVFVGKPWHSLSNLFWYLLGDLDFMILLAVMNVLSALLSDVNTILLKISILNRTDNILQTIYSCAFFRHIQAWTKMANILQTTYSNTFSLQKTWSFYANFTEGLNCQYIQLVQHSVQIHFLRQWWSSSLLSYGITGQQWVKLKLFYLAKN